MKPWYEELFSNYARAYDRERFTQGTLQEVDFIEAEIAANKTVRILDIGCGTGRHAIELARRGYQVTGIDLSANQLARAREKAIAAGVQPVFEQRDARVPHFLTAFDLVLMLCENVRRQRNRFVLRASIPSSARIASCWNGRNQPTKPSPASTTVR